MDGKPWHDDDAFWRLRSRFMFTPASRERAVAEVDRIVERFDFAAGAAVLDMCCGQGRHSIELARRGFAVTAVDRNGPYLDEARRLASNANVTIEFVQDDMRRFCRANSFDGVVNLYTSFGYFVDADEDRAVVENLHQCLRAGGRLIMDIVGKEIVAREFQSRDWTEQDGVLLVTERTIEQNWSWIKVRDIYIEGGRPEECCFEHRLYSAVELKDLLLSVGFSDVQIFGTLHGLPYDDQARRLIAVATK